MNSQQILSGQGSLNTSHDQTKRKLMDQHVRLASQKTSRYYREQKTIKKKPQNLLLRTLRINKLVETFGEKLLLNAYLFSKKSQHIKKYLVEKYLLLNKDSFIGIIIIIIGHHNDNCLYQIPLLSTSSKICVIWDILAIVILFISLWIFTFETAFIGYPNQHIEFISFIIIFCLSFDIILTLNREIIHKGEVLTLRIQVAEQFLKKNGLTDISLIIIWVCSIFITYPYAREIFTIIYIIQSSRRLHSKMLIYMESVFFKGILHDLIDLLKLITTIYFFAHIMACLWFYVSFNTSSSGRSWLIERQILNEDIWTKYNQSFYWATMTMTTIGYGDITPQNQIETMFCSIIMFCSTCTFGYAMNSIGTILSNINQASLQYKQKLVLINSYMNSHSVDVEFQNRVRNYLRYYTEWKSCENNNEIRELTDNLPQQLKIDLLNNINTQIITKIPLLNRTFSQETIKLLADQIEIIHYTPHEVIYHQQSFNNYLYFIIKGQVKICEEESQQVLQILTQDQCFGQYQYFTGFKPQATAVSIDFTNICRFQRSALLEIIKSNQNDIERYRQICDQVIFNQNYKQIDLICNICHETTHQNIRCPSISYRPNLEKLIKKENFISNPRNNCFKRNRNLKSNCFNQLDDIQDIALFIQNEGGTSVKEYISLPQFGDTEYSINDKDDKDEQFKPGDISDDLYTSSKDIEQPIQQIPQFQLLQQFDHKYKNHGEYKNPRNQSQLQSGTVTHIQTKSRKSAMRSSIQAFQIPNRQQVQQNVRFELSDDCTLKNFKLYFPQGNLNQILNNYQRRRQLHKNILGQNLYSFYALVLKSSQKFKLQGQIQVRVQM